MVKSESLTAVGDTTPAALRDVARRLEQFRIALASVVSDARRPLPLPTLVYVFASRAAIQPFLPLRDGRPAALRGYFHRDADQYALAMSMDEDEESASIVFHEYTHLLVQRARTLPIWLNEGLAEYFSTFALASRGRSARDRPPDPQARAAAAPAIPAALRTARGRRFVGAVRRRRAPLDFLRGGVGADAFPDAGSAGRTGADQSVWRGGRRRACARSGVSGCVRRHASGVRAAASRGTCRARRSDRAPIRSPHASTPSASGRRERCLQGEADAWLGDLQRRIGRQAEGAARIERAIAQDPKTARVYLALGRLRLDQDRAPEARMALSKAIEIDPTSADAFAWSAYATW